MSIPLLLWLEEPGRHLRCHYHASLWHVSLWEHGTLVKALPASRSISDAISRAQLYV